MNLEPATWSAVSAADFTDAQKEALDSWFKKYTEKYAVRGSCVDGARPTTLAQLRARLPQYADKE
jgi:hypothetical protein